MTHRFTKIIATLGPAVYEPKMLEALHKSGADIVRFNMSHGDYDTYKAVLKNIARMRKHGKDFGLLFDIRGPQVRTGDLKDPVKIKKGEVITLSSHPLHSRHEKYIWVNYDGFAQDVRSKDIILIDGGLLKLKVIEKKGQLVRCKAMGNFLLKSRRHVHLPQSKLSMPSVTRQDWKDIDFAIKSGAHYIALSFVRKAEDVKKVKAYLDKKKCAAKIIAKIETESALECLKDIINASDGIMVARGDLGSDLPLAEVPIWQEKIIQFCNAAAKPVIVATQILESMIEHPLPTRAEISDLVTAVKQGADCVMLSGETAVGKYPIDCVKTMVEAITRTEEHTLQTLGVLVHDHDTIKEELSEAASVMALNLEANALVVLTHSGRLARFVSRCRAGVPILAFARDQKAVETLGINWGVRAFHYASFNDPESKIQKVLQTVRKQKLLKTGSKIVILADIMTRGGVHVPTVQVRTV